VGNIRLKFKEFYRGFLLSIKSLEETLPPKYAHCESMIIAKNCSTIMLSLVNDILDFGRHENKKLELNYENVDLEKFMEEIK